MARLGPVLDALDDGEDAPLVALALARAPFATHDTLRVACRRLNTIVASPVFREWRAERGLAEHGLIIAGGRKDDGPTAECAMFSGGRWRSIAPLSDPRQSACSAIV